MEEIIAACSHYKIYYLVTNRSLNLLITLFGFKSQRGKDKQMMFLTIILAINDQKGPLRSAWRLMY